MSTHEDDPAPPDQDGVFAFFSLEGSRFNSPGMPADSARELVLFREAVYRVARSMWLANNPDRRKTPDGFNDAFDLRLTEVITGSAQPKLILNRPHAVTSDDEWDEWATCYAAARDRVTAALSDTVASGEIPAEVPEAAKSAFRNIGSTLRPSESLTIGSPSDRAHRARLEKSVKKLIHEIDEVAPPEPVEVSIVGVICEYDGSGRSFQLESDTGKISCRLDIFTTALARRVADNLALDGVTAPDVRVEGWTFDPVDHVRLMSNVYAVEIIRTLEEKIVVTRLNQLRALEPGWMGPGAEPPAQRALELTELILPILATIGIDYGLASNTSGGVVIEWARGPVEFTATIKSSGTMYFVADNTESDELFEQEFDFSSKRLERFLRVGRIE